jgi:translation elongation factor EF-Tu-like GTPase
MAAVPEFKAEVRFLSLEEGGGQHPTVQGYRADVHWDAD